MQRLVTANFLKKCIVKFVKGRCRHNWKCAIAEDQKELLHMQKEEKQLASGFSLQPSYILADHSQLHLPQIRALM